MEASGTAPAAVEYRPLNLTLRSAEGIKTVSSLFSKMDAFADVSIAGYPRSRQRTPVDKNCGSHPRWNFPMEFIVDEPYLTQPGLSLLVEIKAEAVLGNGKLVGVVTIPIHELFQASAADPAADRSVEYQVTAPSGKPKGILRFSYRFGEKFTQESSQASKAAAVPAYPPAVAAAPYPAAGGYQSPYCPPAAGYYPHHYAHPASGYYPPPAGYYPPAAYGQSSGYGCQAPPPKSGMGGMGMGLALGAGLLGGLAVGEMASDIGDAAAYADGYGDAIGDMDF
ncbi:protein SRC2 homolog [Andrographis paniculata]|uniref:protein SRC2 homolog n=1 Tax=Andrographis paniculata TaxID=175694 RepID=UPI0021E7613D|nr:protein SRC2 homolog [Andrographis paniculata]